MKAITLPYLLLMFIFSGSSAFAIQAGDSREVAEKELGAPIEEITLPVKTVEVKECSYKRGKVKYIDSMVTSFSLISEAELKKKTEDEEKAKAAEAAIILQEKQAIQKEQMAREAKRLKDAQELSQRKKLEALMVGFYKYKDTELDSGPTTGSDKVNVTSLKYKCAPEPASRITVSSMGSVGGGFAGESEARAREYEYYQTRPNEAQFKFLFKNTTADVLRISDITLTFSYANGDKPNVFSCKRMPTLSPGVEDEITFRLSLKEDDYKNKLDKLSSLSNVTVKFYSSGVNQPIATSSWTRE